jgi:hypothetical protein
MNLVDAIANGAPDFDGAKIFSMRLRDMETQETAMGSSVLERISTVPTRRGLHTKSQFAIAYSWRELGITVYAARRDSRSRSRHGEGL